MLVWLVASSTETLPPRPLPPGSPELRTTVSSGTDPLASLSTRSGASRTTSLRPAQWMRGRAFIRS